MTENLKELGIAGLIILLFLQAMFKFLLVRHKQTTETQEDPSLDEIIEKIHELHAWHAKTDQHGEKRWYTPLELMAKNEDLEKKIDHYYEEIRGRLEKNRELSVKIAMKLGINSNGS